MKQISQTNLLDERVFVIFLAIIMLKGKGNTSSPVKAVNLESTTGSFLSDKVMTSDSSDILPSIS